MTIEAVCSPTKLGGVRDGQRIDDEIRAAGAAQTARANARAADVAPIIAEFRAAGASLNAIAAELTARGIPTAAGKSAWTAAGVKRVIERAQA